MDGKNISQNPMDMPSWSIGMACVWIANRSPEAATRLWNNGLLDAWMDLDGNANEAVQDAREVLQNALTDGTVSATGIAPSGQREPITELEWEDIEFAYDLEDDGDLVHLGHNSSGKVYRNILVSKDDVVKKWPQEKRAPATILPFRGKTGPRTGKLALVKSRW